MVRLWIRQQYYDLVGRHGGPLTTRSFVLYERPRIHLIAFPNACWQRLFCADDLRRFQQWPCLHHSTELCIVEYVNWDHHRYRQLCLPRRAPWLCSTSVRWLWLSLPPLVYKRSRIRRHWRSHDHRALYFLQQRKTGRLHTKSLFQTHFKWWD